MRRATTRPKTDVRPGRVSGVIQLGAAELWVGPRDVDGFCEYVVAAPVMPCFGMRVRPGLGPWVLQHGRTHHDDATIEARCELLYRDGMLLHSEGCAVEDWPYESP